MSTSQTKNKANDYEITCPLEDNNHRNASTDVPSLERSEFKRSLPQDETTLSSLIALVEHFDQINLREPLLRGIYNYGFERPTNIQQRALKPCISGYDAIVQAQSGTGKTITFIIAILQQLDMNCKDCQALILVPTRELGQSIHKVVLALGEYINVTCHACVGGKNICEDMKRLEAGVQVVVGTPGRIYDMLKKSIFRTENIKMFVLDETDELLSRGFRDQIYDILTMLSESIQVIIVSTTMPCDLLEIADKCMNDPMKILTKIEERTLEGIRQFYVIVEHEECKLDKLYELFDTLMITQTIIFCNTCQKVNWLSEKLRARDLTVSILDRNMNAEQRNNAMSEFRKGSSRILVRTDRSEDDTDIPQLSPIINYDLPTNPETYVHRIGRRGRFGRKGIAVNFINNDEQQTLHDIEQYYDIQIEKLPTNIVDLV